ncbi:WbuC family cupin fold metalloprotein [Pelotalea chapellei]|uniref:WbuC family cupin fold metalloprotein n=1 Tax=Pelotalea chapellei TaxID=44671 RepID=A0ABS5U9H6_9BACT|nr:WbuC family cupin fold metalloprotein [Pelotalea chapellei]MBT1072314.1 WbuC family cupin fold metalloprotein [Pelotalea chapellei]
MKVVTGDLLQQVTSEARVSPRLRMNHNIHPSDESRCHRLLNAIEPDSYIRPHRHLDPEKDEAFIIMKGRLGVIMFADDGGLTELVELSRDSGNLAADIPSGNYHTAVSLEPGTVFYEVKAGPYLPLLDEEKAFWAPADDETSVQLYLEKLRGLFG